MSSAQKFLSVPRGPPAGTPDLLRGDFRISNAGGNEGYRDASPARDALRYGRCAMLHIDHIAERLLLELVVTCRQFKRNGNEVG